MLVDIKSSKRVRDSQKSKVYKADTILMRWEHNKSIPDLDSIEKFLAKIWKSKRVQKAFPQALKGSPPILKDGRRCRAAFGSSYALTLPRWSRNEAMILHELAHCIHDREGSQGQASHGWEYCEIYLKLVRLVMGKDAETVLKTAFKEHKVKYTKPRAKRVLTEEQKQALRDRLALARKLKGIPADYHPTLAPHVRADLWGQRRAA